MIAAQQTSLQFCSRRLSQRVMPASGLLLPFAAVQRNNANTAIRRALATHFSLALGASKVMPIIAQDDVGSERKQVRCVFAGHIRLASAPAVIDPHVLADRPTQSLEGLLKHGDANF